MLEPSIIEILVALPQTLNLKPCISLVHLFWSEDPIRRAFRGKGAGGSVDCDPAEANISAVSWNAMSISVAMPSMPTFTTPSNSTSSAL